MVASTQGAGRASEDEVFVRAAEAIETAEAPGVSKPSYRSILRNFAVRLCVAVTITIAMLVALALGKVAPGG